MFEAEPPDLSKCDASMSIFNVVVRASSGMLQPCTPLAFLVLPEFQNYSLAAAIEPLFVANWLAQEPLFAWRIVSADGKPVRASNGMTTPVDGDLAAAEACRTVFVLASFDFAAERPAAVLPWLRRLGRFGTVLGGIENGSLTLAEAGLLDGHAATIHWDNLTASRSAIRRSAPCRSSMLFPATASPVPAPRRSWT
ncbi:MAG: AraC family transcriptional regulator [Aliidongia sp.]